MFFRRRKHEIEGETLEELLESAGLGDRLEALQAEELPAVWLRTESSEDGRIAVGRSKLGGAADLPEGLEWPGNGDRPLMFLAQIQFDELVGIPGSDVLPERGQLLFFYDEEQPWGFAPEHASGWRVIFNESGKLHRVQPPSGCATLPVCSIEARAKTSIPDIQSAEVEDLVLSNAEIDDYVEMSKAYAARFPGPEHQMLGHPALVQNDMRWDCALVSAGFDLGDGSAYRIPGAEELAPEAAAWKLLLQLDSDEDAGMMWGDLGLLYFWIHEDDLARRDFSKVRVMLQCS